MKFCSIAFLIIFSFGSFAEGEVISMSSDQQRALIYLMNKSPRPSAEKIREYTNNPSLLNPTVEVLKKRDQELIQFKKDERKREEEQKLEALLKEKEEALKKAEKVFDEAEEFEKAFDQKAIDPATLGRSFTVNPDNVDALLDMYRKNPPTETTKLIGEKLKKFPILSNPKLITFFDQVLRDKSAVKDIIKMKSNLNKVYLFIGLNILLFFFGFYLRAKMSNKDGSFFDTVANWFKRWIVLTGLRAILLVAFFGQNLKRTFEIFLKNYL